MISLIMDEKMDYSTLKSWFGERRFAHVVPAYDGLKINMNSVWRGSSGSVETAIEANCVDSGIGAVRLQFTL